MKDVRKDYPNPGDVKKLFPEWYLEDENMDVVEALATVRKNLHNTLMDFAMDVDLMYVCLIPSYHLLSDFPNPQAL